MTGTIGMWPCVVFLCAIVYSGHMGVGVSVGVGVYVCSCICVCSVFLCVSVFICLLHYKPPPSLQKV